MNIDWDLAIKIIVPFATLFLGRWIDRIYQKRSKLISYVGHVSSFRMQDTEGTQIYTHSIVVRNAGRESAKNVRIGHNVLPNYQVFPAVHYEVVPTTGGGAELLIPTLVPGEQLTISYLYFPPMTWDKINSYAKSDDGFAKIITVLPTPQPARWVLRMIWTFVFVGFVSTTYLITDFVIYLIKFIH